MPWLILFLAAVFECSWAVGLKYTHGFTRLTPSLLTLAAMALSVWLLGRASLHLPIGTAYAVWVGLGAAGTVVLGIFLFQEPVSPARLFFLGLMLLAIVGLKFTA
jgi:quaternary ammonium compound-resistance protein SugE